MAAKNLSVFLHAPFDFRLQENEVPKPRNGEVQVAVEHCGICGTDVHFYKDGYVSDIKLSKPTVLGHEGSGRIIALGNGVTNFKVGDRIVIEPGSKCGTCKYCSGGRYNLCQQSEHLSLCPCDGMMTRFICVSEKQCFKIPDNMSFLQASLVEPMSVAYHACKRGDISVGKTVLICGAGPIGAVCFLMAKAFGAVNICITDIVSDRVEFAKTKLGVPHTLHIVGHDAEAHAKQAIEKLGCCPDVVLECSGDENAIQMGVHAIDNGGIFVQVGISQEYIKIPLLEVLLKEIDVRGTFRFINCFPLVIDMMASGRIDGTQLITHHFPLAETAKAFVTFSSATDGCMKITIDCQK